MSAGRGVIWRVLDQDTRVGNYVLPRNATIVAPTASIHSNPDCWPEPGKFKPERFLTAEPISGAWICHSATMHVLWTIFIRVGISL